MNLRQIRKKIKTVDNIKKITRALELVSAVKMKKAQQLALSGRPYQETLERVIKKVVQIIDPQISSLLLTNQSLKKGIILISTNKGLCGSFNFNLFRFILNKLDLSKTTFITVGKQGSFFINKIRGTILADFSSTDPETAVSAIFQLALTKFLAGELGQIDIAYNLFISSFRSQPVMERLLPLALTKDFITKEVKELEESYLIEPAPEMILDTILRNFIEQKIRAALISSQAGEHSARMLAMKTASDNASELIQELTLIGNQVRQEKITYELLDMVTAKESVESF